MGFEFKTVLDHLPYGVQVIDAKMRYRYLNYVLLESIQKSPEEVLGKKMTEVYSGIEQTEIYQRILQCHQTHEPATVINEFVFPDGRRTFHELSLEWTSEGVMVVSKDITKSKDGEWLLQESNKKLEERIKLETDRLYSFFSAARDPIVTIDANGIITSANPSTFDLFGYELSELLEQNIKMLMPEPFRSEHDGYIQNFLKSGKANIIGTGRKVTALKKNGETFPIYLNIGEIKSDGRNRFVGTMQDISELVARENELTELNATLRKEKQNFESIFLYSATPMFILDPSKGEIIECNSEFEKTLRGSREQIVGIGVIDISSKVQADGVPSDEKAGEKIAEVLKNGRARFEWTHRRLDGEEFIVEVSVSLIEYRGKQAMLCGWSDITDRVKAQRASERESENTAIFISSMNHELRTPLNAILGISELLQEEDQKNSEQLVQLLSKTTTTLLSTINDVLDIQKIRAGEIIIEAMPFNLMQIIKDAVSLFRLSAREKEIKINYSIEDGFPEVILGDPTKLKQILNNLIGNAVKFTSTGRIDVLLKSDQQFYELSVNDTGIGIPEEKLETVFEHFKQADGSTTREYGGTGLGLSICKSFVELMSGSLSISSQLGHGSSFAITLPLMEAEKSLSTSSRSVEMDRLKILVAEDSEDNVFLFRAFLKKKPVELVIANDGAEALRAYQASPSFDGILLDMQMPVMDGFEAAKAIRKFEEKSGIPPVPIIACTASAMDSDRKQALSAGCDTFLSKPISREKLFETLAKLQKRVLPKAA